MSWWDDKAARLQASVRSAERDMPEIDMYEDQEIKRAVLHTREDIVMVLSLLSSLNGQIRTVQWLLAVIVALLAYAAFR